jgi:hypothetical protein
MPPAAYVSVAGDRSLGVEDVRDLAAEMRVSAAYGVMM